MKDAAPLPGKLLTLSAKIAQPRQILSLRIVPGWRYPVVDDILYYID